jgi:hypothetical protein
MNRRTPSRTRLAGSFGRDHVVPADDDSVVRAR